MRWAPLALLALPVAAVLAVHVARRVRRWMEYRDLPHSEVLQKIRENGL